MDFNLNPNIVEGFGTLGALCTKEEMQEDPASSLRPFDQNRSGTVVGDGGTVFVMMT